MNVRIIYFESATEEVRSILSKYSSDDMQIIYWTDLDKARQLQELEQANYLVTASYPITEKLLQYAKKVKLIQKTGSGVDNIDLKAADLLGIKVANTLGVNATSVVEATFGMILSLYRKLHHLDRLTKSGEWKMFEYRSSMYEISGKTHGVIGIGHIGKKVAELSQKFGANVLYYDAHRLSAAEETERKIQFRSLDELLSKADIVSLHIPLLPSTENLISKKELSLMKPTAVLVNVSRGGIINERDLADALENKRLLGAAIDTWAHEPVNADNPLLKFDNVLATPHIAGGTRDALEKVLAIAFENIRNVENEKRPSNLVEVSY
ncbi:2-hydroxyacid dehydrogenase [Psychrobacillus sp. NPDC096623]|uniref:2-hydroxyacid dehydrogenase n=1 Tax=Psychrobacillus sp. NPDC096623 TaxID=3364492 RepID=UPI00380980F4